jgi:hypothetical protein
VCPVAEKANRIKCWNQRNMGHHVAADGKSSQVLLLLKKSPLISHLIADEEEPIRSVVG